MIRPKQQIIAITAAPRAIFNLSFPSEIKNKQT